MVANKDLKSKNSYSHTLEVLQTWTPKSPKKKQKLQNTKWSWTTGIAFALEQNRPTFSIEHQSVNNISKLLLQESKNASNKPPFHPSISTLLRQRLNDSRLAQQTKIELLEKV